MANLVRISCRIVLVGANLYWFGDALLHRRSSVGVGEGGFDSTTRSDVHTDNIKTSHNRRSRTARSSLTASLSNS